jgi:endonuclease-3
MMEKNIKKRALWIFKTLKKAYPNAHIELDYKNPLELLVATILSAQCTDKRVNIVTKDVFRKYKKASDYAAVPLAKFEAEIRSTGFYKNKAKNIREACRVIAEEHHGRVPDTMEALVALSGIGRKTANVILGSAYKKNEGVVVDTHVSRISQLLELTKKKDPEKIEQDLMEFFPRKDWTFLSHLLIRHGRLCCVARRPDCGHCPVQSQCPHGIKKRKAG